MNDLGKKQIDLQSTSNQYNISAKTEKIIQNKQSQFESKTQSEFQLLISQLEESHIQIIKSFYEIE
jgi:hypothetical protein